MAGFLTTITGCFVVLVLLLQLTSGLEPCYDRCPTDDVDRFHIPYPNRLDHLLSWEGAHDLCASQGFMLPTIRSQCDQYQLSSYLQTMGVYEYDVWLGGKTKKNHEWEWLDGSPLVDHEFTNQTTGHHFAYIWLSPTVRLSGENSSSKENRFICEYRDSRMCEEADKQRIGDSGKSFNGTGNKCYVPSGHALNWYNARTYCRRRGGDMATSSDVVSSFARYNSTGKEKYFWVGLRQVKWRWENDDDIDMTFFRIAEVDQAGNDSDCLYSLRGEQWLWDSRPCNRSDHTLIVVCQKANKTSWKTNLTSMLPWRPDCSDNSLSWKIGTCSLIVITVLLLATVVALTLYLRRLLKASDPEAHPKEVSDKEKTRTQDVSSLSYAVEEHMSSTSLTTKIVEKKGETPKKLPTIFPDNPDQMYSNNLPQFPAVLTGAFKDPVSDYAVEIHHISEYRKQISTFSSLSYENVTSMHPIQNEVGIKANTHPVKPKPKPAPKKTNGKFRDTCQPYSNPTESTVYDVERAGSPSQHSVATVATANASDISLTQHNTNKDNKRRILREDDCENGEETSNSTPGTQCGEAVSYANAEYWGNFKKDKFPTDRDGYLQPINLEQASARSTINEHSIATATYTNASEMKSSSQHYANEDKTTSKKKSKILSGLTRRLRKPRAKDPVSPTTFSSAFRKYSAAKSVSFDRSYSNVKSSKGSVHIYAEILADEEEASASTSQPTDVQNTKKESTKANDTATRNTKTGKTHTEHTKTESTNKGHTNAEHTKTGHTKKLRKKLSIKKWSENEGAVGY